MTARNGRGHSRAAENSVPTGLAGHAPGPVRHRRADGSCFSSSAASGPPRRALLARKGLTGRRTAAERWPSFWPENNASLRALTMGGGHRPANFSPRSGRFGRLFGRSVCPFISGANGGGAAAGSAAGAPHRCRSGPLCPGPGARAEQSRCRNWALIVKRCYRGEKYSQTAIYHWSLITASAALPLVPLLL